MNGLTDFSNLRKKPDDFNSGHSKSSTTSLGSDLDFESN